VFGRWLLLGDIGAMVIDSAKAGILWLIRMPTHENNGTDARPDLPDNYYR
jgi:hypothetical protein